jgi:hypothetical protein
MVVAAAIAFNDDATRSRSMQGRVASPTRTHLCAALRRERRVIESSAMRRPMLALLIFGLPGCKAADTVLFPLPTTPIAPIQVVDLGSLSKTTYVTGEQGAPVDVTLRNVSTAPFAEDIDVDFTIQDASTGASTNLFHNTHTLAESGAQIAPGGAYVAGILPYFLAAVGSYEARLCVSWGPDPASPDGQDCRDMGPVAIIELAQPTAAVSLESSQANADGTQSIAVGVTNTSNAKLNYELAWVLTNQATGQTSGPFPFSAGTSAALTIGVGEHQSASFTLSPVFGAGDYAAHLSCWASPGNLTVGCGGGVSDMMLSFR